MRSIDNSITSVAALGVIAAAARRGLASGPLFELVGLDAQAAPQPDRHIPASAYVALWERVVRQVGDPSFAARLGLEFEVESLEGFGFLAMSCATLAQAYERTRVYRSLYNVGSAWELEQAGPSAMRMRWEAWLLEDAPEVGRRAVNEYQLAEMLAAVRKLSGLPRFVPTRVCLRHSAGGDPTLLGQVLGICPEFNAEFDGFEVPRELLDRQLSFSNAGLCNYFDRQCKETSQRFEADAAVTGKVRRKIIEGMNGSLPSLRHVARALGSSTRSLQRALDAEGTKFNDLVDDVRREFAQRYLARRSLNISEVSYLVGFSDTSAFFKAFKRWTGSNPSEWRAAQTP